MLHMGLGQRLSPADPTLRTAVREQQTAGHAPPNTSGGGSAPQDGSQGEMQTRCKQSRRHSKEKLEIWGFKENLLVFKYWQEILKNNFKHCVGTK